MTQSGHPKNTSPVVKLIGNLGFWNQRAHIICDGVICRDHVEDARCEFHHTQRMLDPRHMQIVSGPVGAPALHFEATFAECSLVASARLFAVLSGVILG